MSLPSFETLRNLIVGVDQPVPLLNGSEVTYVNLDNAASTPPFRSVQDAVDRYTPWYSSVHRGSGFKSRLSTELFDETRGIIGRFVGADPERDVVIFGKNASEAINKLAHRFPFSPGDMVLTTVMEHHSNDLPWRSVAQVIYAEICSDGSLDLDDLRNKLRQNEGKIKLVTVTGASNVSGYLLPIYEIAELAHQHGALIAVDAAQLFPHRKIDMQPHGSNRHLDFVAIAGHKAYAPFGAGALIGSKAVLNQGEPDYKGGGTIDLVTLDEVAWADTPERDEAGSPNVVGAVAMAAAIKQMEAIGMDQLAQHEKNLTRYALEKLNQLPGVRLYGSNDPDRLSDRLGVIALNVENYPHGLLAAILSYEGGIGVRDGCFCAHPYVLRLLKVGKEEFSHFREEVLKKNRTDLPGMIRVSFGCYNNFADIDRLVSMLQKIILGEVQGEYSVNPRTGVYSPDSFKDNQYQSYFSF